jgi:hypothetical protein
MSNRFFGKIRAIWHTEFLSPIDLTRRALILALIYGVLHLVGLRDFVSILNGTVGSVRLGWGISVFLGLLYVVAWLSFVLLVPTLLLAGMFLYVWNRLTRRRQE